MNNARNLLSEHGNNFGEASVALAQEYFHPAESAVTLDRARSGEFSDTPELLALGYAGLHFNGPLRDDVATMSRDQRYSIEPGSGYKFSQHKFVPAFGQFSDGDVFGSWQVPRYIAVEDHDNGGFKPQADGDYPYRVIWLRDPQSSVDPTHLWSYAEFIAYLTAHPIDLKTREGGPVATGG